MEKIMSMTGELSRPKKNGWCKAAPKERCRRRGEARFALRLARKGEWVEVVSLSGGRGCQDRLAGLGLRIGARMQVLRNDMEGKLLLSHQGARLYLGGGMAHKIEVASIKEDEK